MYVDLRSCQEREYLLPIVGNRLIAAQQRRMDHGDVGEDRTEGLDGALGRRPLHVDAARRQLRLDLAEELLRVQQARQAGLGQDRVGFDHVVLCGIERQGMPARSEEHTSELQSRLHLVCRLLLEKKKKKKKAS